MRKVVPFSPNEIDKTTQWLNDLARDGLCVETWGSFWVKLKEGEAGDWIYRIDIDDGTGDPNYQRKLELDKQGWQYVQTIGTTRHHIYRTRNQVASLEWNAEYIEKYRKYLRSNVLWGTVAVFVYVIFCLWLTVFRNGEYLLLSLVEASGPAGIIVALLSMSVVIIWVMELMETGKTERRLTYGNQMTEKSDDSYQRDLRLRPKFLPGLGKILIMVVPLGSVVLSLDIEPKGHNFDGSQSGLVCVDLQNVQEDGFVLKEITWDDNPGVNFGNRILEKSGLFAEYLYEVNQYGIDAVGEDVQITGHYYKLRPDSITDAVREQLIDRSVSYMYEHQWLEEDKKLPEDFWEISEAENTGFTKMVVVEAIKGEGPLMIFAQVEDIIIYLRYYGNLPAEIFVEELIRLYM